MADKNFVKNIVNKGNMIVLLSLQQVSLKGNVRNFQKLK